MHSENSFAQHTSFSFYCNFIKTLGKRSIKFYCFHSTTSQKSSAILTKSALAFHFHVSPISIFAKIHFISINRSIYNDALRLVVVCVPIFFFLCFIQFNSNLIWWKYFHTFSEWKFSFVSTILFSTSNEHTHTECEWFSLFMH